MPQVIPKNPTQRSFTQPENPLVEDEKVEIVGGNDLYNDKDREYITYLQGRLERAKRLNDQTFPELDDKTRYQYYEENEAIANTRLPKKKNEDDVIVSAGTIEQKLDALLSNINNLNITNEVQAFDKNNNRVQSLGTALEDIMEQVKELDGADGAGDDEKKLERQRELLKQGTVFVQQEWARKFETKKRLREKYDGRFKDFQGYDEKLELVFEGPTRTLLYGPNVYLGDITEFYMQDQPFIFVLFHQDYDVAKAKYGKFENWKYVQKGAVPSTNADTQKTIYDNKWRLSEVKENQVEIVLYQDKPNDEFQIIINGVLMLPIGFPLSAVTPRGGYNIVKQIFRIINSQFAFGGSFVSSGSVKELSNLIDEMLKLFVLKTRKSFTPAYVNTSGRVINKKVLSPGRISMGFDASSLTPIAGNEVQGITAGEVQVLQTMRDLVNQSTLSNQFTGQQGKSGTTATEIATLQQQAKLTLGLAIASCSFLEKKLDYLLLDIILESWFNPIDTQIDEVRGEIEVFNNVNREVNIEGEGLGQRQTIVTNDQLPTRREIRNMELSEEKRRGYPFRMIFIKKDGLKTAKLMWKLVTVAKEKPSSSINKLMFREMLGDMLTLIQLGSQPNLDGLEEEYSKIWKKRRNKLFSQQQPVGPEDAGVSPADQAAAAQGRASQAGIPSLPAGALAEVDVG